METTLVILAGGLGSRFGGNKQISQVGPNGEILMEYSIYDAIAAGFTQIVFILKEEMVELVRESIGKKIEGRVRVDYVVQDMTQVPEWYTVPAERVKPLGTTHAVLCAKDVIAGPFATVNADDYYGREAFVMMKKLLDGMSSKEDACIIPYVLGNTMSENGGVTRGVCRLCRGRLSGIQETHEIHYDEAHSIVSKTGKLTGSEPVSMNLWGFHPDLLADMQTYFEDFLRALSPEELKAECLLPVMVGDFLKEKRIRVKALTSPDRWFGITYQADREDVIAELAALHESGVYPKTLY
ncbi:MAG: NTP transferase domain-containing protein [Clostridia bacterium]|nr:NTP transferase domain-containing protein [Clostridia bacterium]